MLLITISNKDCMPKITKKIQFSDIDIAIVSADFDDIYDCMAILMGMTWDIDARIEPHPMKKKDFDEVSDYFVKEIIDTGIKVA